MQPAFYAKAERARPAATRLNQSTEIVGVDSEAGQVKIPAEAIPVPLSFLR